MGDLGAAAVPEVVPDGAADAAAEAAADAVAVAAERLQTLCLGRGITVAAAESCTGGGFAHAVTTNAGSSGYFIGSIVSYADTAKTALLDVDPDVLAAHGAVSAQVALAMATGARDRFGATIAVAITGISGPGGATPDKPVGLTYIGLATPIGTDVRRTNWTGDRAANRAHSVRAALDWLVEWVEAHPA